MTNMHRHAEARRHPASVPPEVRSVVMLGMNYYPGREEEKDEGNCGRIARYARGADYHDVLRERLNRLLAWLQSSARAASAAAWWTRPRCWRRLRPPGRPRLVR